MEAPRRDRRDNHCPAPTLPPGCAQSLPGSLELDTVRRSKGAGQWLSCLSPGPDSRGCRVALACAPGWSPKVRRQPGGPDACAWQSPRVSIHRQAQPGQPGTHCPPCADTWLCLTACECRAHVETLLLPLTGDGKGPPEQHLLEGGFIKCPTLPWGQRHGRWGSAQPLTLTCAGRTAHLSCRPRS